VLQILTSELLFSRGRPVDVGSIHCDLLAVVGLFSPDCGVFSLPPQGIALPVVKRELKGTQRVSKISRTGTLGAQGLPLEHEPGETEQFPDGFSNLVLSDCPGPFRMQKVCSLGREGCESTDVGRRF